MIEMPDGEIGRFAHNMQRSVTILFLCTLIVFGLAVSPCESQQEGVKGELKLEGECVTRLVLRRTDGGTERFDRPGKTIQLPPGEYQLLESHLEGGYTCRFGPAPEQGHIEIDANEPAVFKVGAPLKQAVRVQRRGRSLTLQYHLDGVGGEYYTSDDRGKPPRFTIYRGEKEIHSDKFRFG
ncbi:MAG: hypothetical protein JSU70_19500 [Phycisphaerales bacterium]|nr:MAG: hypothetical protein JSU70_19500 [Phycisphaerales bacterium]